MFTARAGRMPPPPPWSRSIGVALGTTKEQFKRLNLFVDHPRPYVLPLTLTTATTATDRKGPIRRARRVTKSRDNRISSQLPQHDPRPLDPSAGLTTHSAQEARSNPRSAIDALPTITSPRSA